MSAEPAGSKTSNALVSLVAPEADAPISSKVVIDNICARLTENEPIRQTLPGGGQLNIERLLP